MELIDTHSHIHLKHFDDDRAQVIERAGRAGVKRIIVLATDLSSSYRAVELSGEYDDIYVAVGIHPCDVQNAGKDDLRKIRDLAESEPKVVAIGETGLDFYWSSDHYEQQYRLFREQIELADALELPVVIHTRSAQREMQWFFQENNIGQLHGVMHCFEGDIHDARFYLEMGLHLSFTANITYANYPNPDIFRQIPLERIMTETDSPYIAPKGSRNKRNEPANVVHVVERLAALLQQPVALVAQQTTINARRFFKLPYS